MQTNFNKTPSFSELFEEISLKAIFLYKLQYLLFLPFESFLPQLQNINSGFLDYFKLIRPSFSCRSLLLIKVFKSFMILIAKRWFVTSKIFRQESPLLGSGCQLALFASTFNVMLHFHSFVSFYFEGGMIFKGNSTVNNILSYYMSLILISCI